MGNPWGKVVGAVCGGGTCTCIIPGTSTQRNDASWSWVTVTGFLSLVDIMLTCMK